MNMSRALARYRILEKVGEGAMGEVYRAEDLQAARKPVAVKALKASRLGSAADRARFLREAQAISQIDHPNVVMLLEVIEDGDGLYLIMQYARGRTLRDILLELINARGEEDDQVAQLAELLPSIERVATYAEEGVLTTDKGLIVEFEDGTAFQITIVRSR